MIALLLCLVGTAAAQQQKIGYVDTDLIIAKIPEYQGIEDQLRQISQRWRNELDQMQQEIDALKEDFEAKEILFTDDIRKQRQQEINTKIRQHEQYFQSKFGPDGEYFQKQKELLEPIQRKVYEAINRIAQREGFDFIFDRSGGTGLLYSRQDWNLNEKVLVELGIDVNQVSN
ncbi:MAG: OmpH family outer membrane protein [Balneolaceae bacterium]|nr:OmpH family outer membrane protein [Balneolaceae bacterium]